MPLLPIYGTLRYDGIGDVFDWHPVLYALLFVGVLMVATAVSLLTRPQRVGAEVSFTPGGFDMKVRMFLRRDRRYQLAWKDVEEMVLVEAPRGSDVLSFRLTHDAAVREGLIRPSTRADAPRYLVKREIVLPTRLTGIPIPEAVERFHASAALSGARLAERSSLNLLVLVRRVWAIEWP